MFARFEQQVTNPDPSGTRGLTVFGAMLKSTGGQAIEDHFIQLGLVQKVPSPAARRTTSLS